MNWILDIALVAIIATIVIVNTCKGFKTVLNLLVTVVSFGAAYYFGPDIGRMFVMDLIEGRVVTFIRNTLDGVIGETVGEITVADLIAKLPESLMSLVDRVGASAESLMDSFGETTIISNDSLQNFAENLAKPVSNWLSIAAGCLIVFVVALLVMLLVKALLGLIIKLPVIKQMGTIFGFIVGVFSAFVWVWVICLAISIFIEYNILGEYNSTLVSLADSSYLYRFFRDFSLMSLLDSVTIQ